jgi:hypothetical protein
MYKEDNRRLFRERERERERQRERERETLTPGNLRRVLPGKQDRISREERKVQKRAKDESERCELPLTVTKLHVSDSG